MKVLDDQRQRQEEPAEDRGSGQAPALPEAFHVAGAAGSWGYGGSIQRRDPVPGSESRSTSRRCQSLRCRGRSRCRDSIRPAPDAGQRRFPSRFSPCLARFSLLIHFLRRCSVRGGSLVGICGRTQFRAPADTGRARQIRSHESDIMYCSSLPDRRPCSRPGRWIGRAIPHLPRQPEVHPLIAHQSTRSGAVLGLSTSYPQPVPPGRRAVTVWHRPGSARNDACVSGTGRVVGSQQEGEMWISGQGMWITVGDSRANAADKSRSDGDDFVDDGVVQGKGVRGLAQPWPGGHRSSWGDVDGLSTVRPR